MTTCIPKHFIQGGQKGSKTNLCELKPRIWSVSLSQIYNFVARDPTRQNHMRMVSAIAEDLIEVNIVRLAYCNHVTK